MIGGMKGIFTQGSWDRHVVLTMLFLVMLSPVFFINVDMPEAAEEKLPDAADILDKHVEVTGGVKAYEKIQNRVTRGIFEIVQAGIKADMIIYQAAPNLVYAKMESVVVGTNESGSNGEVAWEKSTMIGPKVKEGEERADALREGIFDPQANWRKHYTKVVVTGIAPVDGKPCYKVLLTPKIGGPQTFYVDKTSYLIHKSEWVSKSPMGTILHEIYVSDYQKVDGILIPHKARTRLAGQEMIITMTSVEHNVNIPAELFKIPDEIQVLLDR